MPSKIEQDIEEARKNPSLHSYSPNITFAMDRDQRSNNPLPPSRDPGSGGANNQPGSTPAPSSPPPPQRGD